MDCNSHLVSEHITQPRSIYHCRECGLIWARENKPQKSMPLRRDLPVTILSTTVVTNPKNAIDAWLEKNGCAAVNAALILED